MNSEGKAYLVASCSIGLGLVCGAGVLLVTTLAWTSFSSSPQVPTVLFFAAMALLAYGCHKIDCLESQIKKR